MKHVLFCVEDLLNDKTVKNLTIKKVEDSKVELWDGSKYFGRHKIDYKK